MQVGGSQGRSDAIHSDAIHILGSDSQAVHGRLNGSDFFDNNRNCPVLSFSNGEPPFDIEKQLLENGVREACEHYGIDNLERVEESFFDAVQKSFRNFFDSLARCGNDEESKSSSDVITGVGNASREFRSVSTAGMTAVRVLTSAFTILCASLAASFESSADEVARTVFSGFCIISAGIRSALPLLAEMAREAKHPEETFIVSVASAVMASVYLATSAISTLLASHHAILNSPSTAQMARKVLAERNREGLGQNGPLEHARASLKKINSMLETWKKNVSANFYALGKEVSMFAGAVVSCFSALAKFAPVLAVPFVSIISGSVSLIANVLETAQGVVEHSRISGELKQLRQLVKDGKKSSDLDEKIQNMERLLHLSKIRIMKGGLNILISVGSIVLGVLPLVISFSMPILPAILSTVSLASVVILGIAGLVVRKMNNAGSVSKRVVQEENSDDEVTKETDSGREDMGETDSDDDKDNVASPRLTEKMAI